MIRRVYLLPNILTTFSLACGLFVIFKMSMVEPGMASFNVLRAGALLLLVAAVADMLDGATARLVRAESEFGVIFDSLSDAVTFGVAPAVMALKSLSLSADNSLNVVASTAAMLYAICGVLRLVRYSVADRVKKPSNSRKRVRPSNKYKMFTGLPIPAAASALVSLMLLMVTPKVQGFIELSDNARALVMIGVMGVLGYFMVSRWKFPGIKFLQFKLWSYHLIFLTVVLAIALFYGILYAFPMVYFGLAWGYLVVAMALSLTRIIAGSRSKTLEDFEPAPEEISPKTRES